MWNSRLRLGSLQFTWEVWFLGFWDSLVMISSKDEGYYNRYWSALYFHFPCWKLNFFFLFLWPQFVFGNSFTSYWKDWLKECTFASFSSAVNKFYKTIDRKSCSYKTACKRTKAVGLSKNSNHWILQIDLHLHPCEIHLRQELLMRDSI